MSTGRGDQWPPRGDRGGGAGNRGGGAGGALTKRMQALAPGTQPALPRQVARRELPAPVAPETPPPAIPDRILAGRGDDIFHPGTLGIIDKPKSPASFWVFVAIGALLVTAFAWSYFGRFASNTSAAGKIQAAGRTKVLESVETGQVVKINARDGDSVEEGEVVVELDSTNAKAVRAIVDQKLTNLRAETLRLRTEIKASRATTVDPKTTIAWGADVPKDVRFREDGVARADLANLAAQLATLTSQKHAEEAKRDKYSKSIEAQKNLVATTKENLTMIESLTKSGYNSQARFLDMKAKLDGQQVALTAFEGSLENAKQAILMIDSQIVKVRETFVSTRTQTVSDNEQTIVDLAQQLIKADQTLGNMTLRAPVSGVIHASAMTTIGQVVKPRQQLMQIVPRDAPLEIQTYISNLDIGFIRKGDPATIKVNTFIYGTYGSVDGTVVDIGSDSLTLQGKATMQNGALDGEYGMTSTAQKTGNNQFSVTIRAKHSTMMIEGKEVPLTAGMAVNVEILTEKRRGIDYIVSPILELLSTAGHEK